jgi:hypothetical protein
MNSSADMFEVRRASHADLLPWWFVAVGTATGLAVGIIARLWMRWISTDPEFTWAGTIAIVMSFTVFALAQSTVAVVRARPMDRRAVTAVRATAALLSAGLFGAAGAVMLPTVLFGSLAAWRSDRGVILRSVFAVLAVPSIAFVIVGILDDLGWGVATIGRIVLFLCLYAAVIAAIRPTVAPVADAWRPSRRLAVGVLVAVVAVVGLALYKGGIQ